MSKSWYHYMVIIHVPLTTNAVNKLLFHMLNSHLELNYYEISHIVSSLFFYWLVVRLFLSDL